VIFKKSVSLFKSKIEKGSVEKGLESFGVWTGWAQTKIDEQRLLSPLPKRRNTILPPVIKQLKNGGKKHPKKEHHQIEDNATEEIKAPMVEPPSSEEPVIS